MIKIFDGGVKVCFFLETAGSRVFTPTDDQESNLFTISEVEEVGSSHAQTTRVVCHLDSIEDLTPARVETLKRQILAVLNGEI